ncbi:GIY-YIG nuclease family protein [Gracilibacillus alcaliphilus]|uniref:GIY-YIG nuclease family protein n=1 Tax=Gracilibacillus alcaliphilus TaxID=1401441 RepID=UPI0019564A87|nr:GIY-YIG nuclease family protein [Gracilibacillus alcaliphilus]MBM7678094.1 putative endonuclease [Gracilibacillus alcaliphilus]
MKETNQHVVYILKCKDHTLYTGYTNNIKRRLAMHEQGKGAKYTRGRSPFELQFMQSCCTKSEALQLEAKIKKLTRKQKDQLIREHKEGYGTDANPEELSK